MQAALSFNSVRQTVKRLEEAAIYYRGPGRVQLLKGWLVSLKEFEELSVALSDHKEKSLEQHPGVDETKENLRKPFVVNNLSAYVA